MRLINAKTLKLEEFIDGRSAPKYAILSHTWCENEVLFHDMAQLEVSKRKKGWKKIELTCAQALKDGLQYAWVDTCCIDKTSSAELSEAINSMFAWYRDSEVCYVYLSDVQTDSILDGDLPWLFQDTIACNDDERSSPRPSILEITPQLRRSRWFARGWTLQELLAPSNLEFFSKDWSYIGSGDDLVDTVASITTIKPSVLRRLDGVQSCSVACRMSWAASRATTRIEDEAYCLLGIFEINMPLLYGEGYKAFIRLQQEIIRVSADQTILAWDRRDFRYGKPGVSELLLAPSAAFFRHSQSISMVIRPVAQSVFEVTHKGVEIMVQFAKLGTRKYAGLNCIDEREPTMLLILELRERSLNVYRVEPRGVELLPRKYLDSKAQLKRITIEDNWAQQQNRSHNIKLKRVKCVVTDARRYSGRVLETFPTHMREPGGIYRLLTDYTSFRIEIKDHQRTGEVASTRFTFIYDGEFNAWIQEEHGSNNRPIEALYNGSEANEMRKLYATYADRGRLWRLRSSLARIGPYNVVILTDIEPDDDAYQQLLFLIYRRPSLLWLVSGKWSRDAWKRVMASMKWSDSSNLDSPLEYIVENDTSIVVSDQPHRYRTRWQGLRIRFANPPKNPKVPKNDRWQGPRLDYY